MKEAVYRSYTQQKQYSEKEIIYNQKLNPRFFFYLSCILCASYSVFIPFSISFTHSLSQQYICAREDYIGLSFEKKRDPEICFYHVLILTAERLMLLIKHRA